MALTRKSDLFKAPRFDMETILENGIQEAKRNGKRIAIVTMPYLPQEIPIDKSLKDFEPWVSTIRLLKEGGYAFTPHLTDGYVTIPLR